MISSEASLVQNMLISKGLETPLIPSELTPEEKYQRIRVLMTDVVKTLGLDLSDDSLAETPHRIAKMYVNEVFSGLDYENFPKISVIDNTIGGAMYQGKNKVAELVASGQWKIDE